MTTGSILLAIALLVILLLYLLRPFLISQPAPTGLPQQSLQAQKEALLDDIRALDFDHEMGKVPDDDYETKRSQLVLQAARVLQQLDQQTAVSDIDVEIETAVAQLRQIPTAPSPSDYCPQCGEAIAEEDNFCAACGQQLEEVNG